MRINTYIEQATPEFVFLYRHSDNTDYRDREPYYEISNAKVYLFNKAKGKHLILENKEKFDKLPFNIQNALRYRALNQHLLSKRLIQAKKKVFFSPDIFDNPKVEALHLNHGFSFKYIKVGSKNHVAVIPERILTKDGKTFDHKFHNDNYPVLSSRIFEYNDFVSVISKAFGLLGNEFTLKFDSGEFVFKQSSEINKDEVFSGGPEPKISFGLNQEIHDFPAAGLKRYGPWDLNISDTVVQKSITVGIIGPGFSKKILNKLVAGEKSGKYPFPGFESVYKRKIVSGGVEEVAEAELLKCNTANDFKKMILEIYKKFDKKPEVLIIELPSSLIKKISNINLRNLLKVIFWEQRQSTQIITGNVDSTSTGLFWDNLALGIYTSAGGKPWVLEEPIENSVFVGMSFGLTPTGKVIGLVEIIDSYGLSLNMQVSELKQIPAGERMREDRDLHFDSLAISKFLKDALDRYKKKYKSKPKRIIIHKTSKFNEEEKKILTNAGIESDIAIDLIYIGSKGNGIFLLEGNKMPNRLTGWKFEDTKAILYTKGSNERGVAIDPFIPKPVLISLEGSTKLDSNYSIEVVCKDLIKLTKLNWNSVNSYEREPVTISHSRRIKELLTLDLNLTEIPQDIKYFL